MGLKLYIYIYTVNRETINHVLRKNKRSFNNQPIKYVDIFILYQAIFINATD